MKFVSPPRGFTDDIRNMLKVMYLIWTEHLHLPDVVMGFEMSAARASAVEQIKTFFAWIENRRLMLEGEGSDEKCWAANGFGLRILWIRQCFRRSIRTASRLVNW